MSFATAKVHDFAAIGKRLFEDAALREKGPVDFIEQRITRVFGRPDVVTHHPLETNSLPLWLKWPEGSTPDAHGDVFFFTLERAPSNWIDEAPAMVATAKSYWSEVGVYAGCIKNATLPHICRQMEFYIAAGYDAIGLDAAGLIAPRDSLGGLVSDWAKVLWIVDTCARAGIKLYVEPVARLSTRGFSAGSIQEEDIARPNWGLGNVLRTSWLGDSARAVPPKHTVIAVQQRFDAKHCEARLSGGFRLALNCQQPEVRAWVRSLRRDAAMEASR